MQRQPVFIARALDPSGTISVPEGTGQCLDIIPDAGYAVTDLVVDGSSVTPNTEFCFPNVQEDHTIAASFQQSSD